MYKLIERESTPERVGTIASPRGEKQPYQVDPYKTPKYYNDEFKVDEDTLK